MTTARRGSNAEILAKKERKALVKARKKAAKKAAPPTSASSCSISRATSAPARSDARPRDRRRATVARPGRDEVVVRIESPGGTVTGYGLAATQLLRLREREDQVDRLRRSGRGERRLSDGLRRRPHRRRAVRDARQHRRRRAGAQPQSPAEEERHRLRGDDGGRIQAQRLDFRRDHPGGTRAFPRQARRDPRGVQAFVKRAGPALDIAKVGNGDVWLGERGARRSASSTKSATGDDYLFRARKERAAVRTRLARSPLARAAMARRGEPRPRRDRRDPCSPASDWRRRLRSSRAAAAAAAIRASGPRSSACAVDALVSRPPLLPRRPIPFPRSEDAPPWPRANSSITCRA